MCFEAVHGAVQLEVVEDGGSTLGWLHCRPRAAGNALPYFTLLSGKNLRKHCKPVSTHSKPAGEFVVLIQQLETKFSFLVIHPRAHYVQLLELEVP